MKVPKLGISDKCITFYFRISKKRTKTRKWLITSEVKIMRYVWKPLPEKEPNSNTICIHQDVFLLVFDSQLIKN